MQLPNNPLMNPRPTVVRQVKPPAKRKLRPAVPLLLAVIFAFVWITRNVRPAVRWDDVAQLMGVQDYERARMLVCLGLVAVAVCAIARILRGKREEE